MAKKILIITDGFSIGGSRVSLNNLLSVLDPDRINVDVFARVNRGPLKDDIINCHILPENVWLSHRIFEKGLFSKVCCIILYYIRGLFQILGFDLFKVYNFIGGKLIHSEEYDAVIGYDECLTRFVSYIPAKKRITWIHCDYRRFAKGIDENKYFKKIDNIVCVSKYAKDSLLDVFPYLESNIVIIRNAINIQNIINKSQIVDTLADKLFAKGTAEKFTLISIGRLDTVKQFDKIPQIAAELKKILKGSHEFQWLIIGGGNEQVREEIEYQIKKCQVSDEVILLGMQSNPYPFLCKSDLYVCTSSSETFSYTIHEALALQIPFICNNFPEAAESVQVGSEGFILPLSDMPQKIADIIAHPFRVNECSITNDQLLQAFYNII